MCLGYRSPPEAVREYEADAVHSELCADRSGVSAPGQRPQPHHHQGQVRRVEHRSLQEDYNTRQTGRYLHTYVHLTNILPTYVQKVMQDANMEKSAVSQIVLVGGSTRIPKVSIVTV